MLPIVDGVEDPGEDIIQHSGLSREISLKSPQIFEARMQRKKDEPNEDGGVDRVQAQSGHDVD